MTADGDYNPWLWLEQSEGKRAGKAGRDWDILRGQQETEDPMKVSARDRELQQCLQGKSREASMLQGLRMADTQKGKVPGVTTVAQTTCCDTFTR